MSDRRQLARLAAPAAFLLAATVLVLLVRSAISADPEPAATTPAAATTARTPAQTEPAAPATTTAPTTTTAPAASTYVIQSGDTLETIAEQFGTSVEELLTLNPDVDPTNLQIGQELRVP